MNKRKTKFQRKLFENKRRLFISLLIIIIINIFIIGYILFLFEKFSVFYKELPYIVGINNEKRYLIILQNNNELRPTGGFISAYGILKIKNGIPAFSIFDSYNLDNTKNIKDAPAPFNHFLKADKKFNGWYFRDGNFSPDFPTSANDLLKLFNEQSHTSYDFDGVIAINFSLIEDIIGIYKNIFFDDTIINKDNLFSWMQNKVKNIDTHDITDLQNRKNVLSKFSKALISKILSTPFEYKTLLNVLYESLNKKDILVYFKDKNIQDKIYQQGWSGSFYGKNYDNFIHTNISNIGGRKADRYISKSHVYFVSFKDNEKGSVTYSLTLKHLGTYSLNSDLYNSYIRIYIPEKSKIEDVWDIKNDCLKKCSPLPFFTGNDIGGKYIGIYTSLYPDDQQTIRIKYILPEKINKDNFSLNIIKQPGTKDKYNVTIQMPNDISFESKDFRVKENIGIFERLLDKDIFIKIKTSLDRIPPIIVWQKFVELNKIEINFSEELHEENLFDINNYEIIDLNNKNDIKDDIKIKEIEKKGNTIYLYTEGITKEHEERYSLIIKNIHDKSWNNITPNPLQVTLVQRIGE